MGERLRDGMHVEAPTEGEKEDVRALMPKDTDVTRLYSEGLALMRIQNCAAARGPLEQAVASDPGFALAHQALAEVLECLGYEKRALDEAERAVALSKELPPETRLQAEAYYHKLTGHPEKAIKAYEELFKRAPDNYDFGIKLLQMQKGVAPEDALKTLAALRALDSPVSESAELDVTEAMLAGNDDAKLAALERARARAEAHGARLVAASAALNVSAIMRKRGDLDKALESARRAKEIFEASGDRDGVIQALEAEALVHQKRRDQAGVQLALRAAQELGKHLDSVRSLASFEQNLADVLVAQGDLSGAESALGDMLRLTDRGHKAGAQVSARLDVALVQLYRGQLDVAAREIERAAAIAEESGSEHLKALALFGKAFMAMVAGDLKTAHRHLDDSVELSPVLVGTGLPEYLEARLAMLEGDAEEAETHALAAVEAQGGEKSKGDHFGREAVLMDALLAQNKAGEAKAVLEGLRARIRGDKDAFTEKLIVNIYDARIRAASPRRADKVAAIAALSAVSKRAADADFVMHRLLADLAAGARPARRRPAARRVAPGGDAEARQETRLRVHRQRDRRLAQARLSAGGTPFAPSRDMNNDEMDGKLKDVKGRVKDAAGALTDDKELQSEGKADRAAGKVQEKFGEARRKVGEAIEDVADKIKK